MLICEPMMSWFTALSYFCHLMVASISLDLCLQWYQCKGAFIYYAVGWNKGKKNASVSLYISFKSKTFLSVHNWSVVLFSVAFLTSFGSDENLQNDHYLISLMDAQGWVPIAIIADFKRVCFNQWWILYY